MADGRFAELGQKIGQLVEEKNAAYGSSFEVTGEFLKILYPKGIIPEQYRDALLLVRIFDKQMRIATAKEALDENPFMDIAGYGICGASVSNPLPASEPLAGQASKNLPAPPEGFGELVRKGA